MNRMPEEQIEKKEVKLQRIRSKEVESQKLLLKSSEVGIDTALKSSKVEESKSKAKEESNRREG